MNVAIYSRGIRTHEVQFYQSFFREIKRLNWKLIIEEKLNAQLQKELGISADYATFNCYSDFVSGIDLAISIGGDGTFLETVRYVRSSGVPIIGINTGRLGFLADVNIEGFEKILDRIQQKDFELQQRSLIKVETERSIFGENNYALNELAVHKKDTASMITIEAYIDGVYLNSYWADGLLVGTSTGSTAYNLSCGGPIISPGSGVHFLTPIAAHNLNVRPIIVPDHLPITLKGVGRDKTFLLTLDSISKPVKSGTEITLYKSDFNINLLKFKEKDFFKTIREKMLWGIDQRND